MKTVYVDESGNLGEKGTRFFVIAFVVTSHPNRIKNIIKHYCSKNNLVELKASATSFPEKVSIFNKICKGNDYGISYIVLDKKNIIQRKLFEDKNLIYNYMFSLLIKKTIKNTCEDLQIILDNHTVKVGSVNSLAEYIKVKSYGDWNFAYNLLIKHTDSRQSKLVQAADLIANAIYAHYVMNKSYFYKMLCIDESIKFPHTNFGL